MRAIPDDAGPYLPPEATGPAPGRARLAGRRVLVVGAGTRPSPEPDPPIGIAHGRGIGGTTAEQWDATFAVNTRAHFLVSAHPLVLDGGATSFG